MGVDGLDRFTVLHPRGDIVVERQGGSVVLSFPGVLKRHAIVLSSNEAAYLGAKISEIARLTRGGTPK